MRLIVALVLGGALTLVGCGSDDGTGGTGGTGGSGSAPTISMVGWEAAAGCTANQTSEVVITVTATGTGTLVYSGSVGGCAGAIDAKVSTISCPNVADYPGTVTVTNAAGNDTVAFEVPVCGSGNCTTEPDTCTR